MKITGDMTNKSVEEKEQCCCWFFRGGFLAKQANHLSRKQQLEQSQSSEKNS